MRLAVVMRRVGVSDTTGEKVPTGGELTLFEAVDPIAGLTSFCCVARRRPRMLGVT